MVAARDDLLDLRTWLRRLASFVPAAHRRKRSPVFVLFNRGLPGRPVSRQAFIARLKLAVRDVLQVSPELYAGYSLRRGGVTALIAAGVPESVIKRHVGWAPFSLAIHQYYDHASAQQKLMPTRALPSFRRARPRRPVQATYRTRTHTS